MRLTIFAAILGSALLIAANVWPANVPGADETGVVETKAAAGANVHFRAVRADWATRAPGNSTVDTEVILSNRSLSRTITLGKVVIVGAGGIGHVLAVDPGLENRKLGPMEQVVLPIDSNIQGIVARTATRSPRDVGSVVVTWTGPADAMYMRAVITTSENRHNTNDDFRTAIVAESYAILP